MKSKSSKLGKNGCFVSMTSKCFNLTASPIFQNSTKHLLLIPPKNISMSIGGSRLMMGKQITLTKSITIQNSKWKLHTTEGKTMTKFCRKKLNLQRKNSQRTFPSIRNLMKLVRAKSPHLFQNQKSRFL